MPNGLNRFALLTGAFLTTGLFLATGFLAEGFFATTLTVFFAGLTLLVFLIFFVLTDAILLLLFII